MLFLVVGAVSATDSINVSNTEDSNLNEDNDDSLSTLNKLEISSEDSISETNIVNSHDDNLGSYPDDTVNSDNISSYGDNNEKQLASDDFEEEDDSGSLSSPSTDSVVADSPSNDAVSAAISTDSSVKSASKVSTKLSIANTHYTKSATHLAVTLKDSSGKSLKNQKISLKVNGKTYSAVTNSKGTASVKTACLAVGTYTVSIGYGGNSNYASSSLSKKVKILSSVVGSDLTKNYGYASKYTATFWKGNSALANTKVSFTVNGKTYTKTTNKKGVAGLDINLPIGKYVITTTNPYSKEKVSHNIVVKKDSTTINHGSDVTYIIPNHKYSFTVTLKSKHGVLIKNAKVQFTYNNKVVTSKTDANGKANITIPVLAKGTYKMSYEFAGNKNYDSSSGKGYLIVKTPTTKLSSSTLKMDYNDGSKVSVKLTSADGKVLAKKVVYFKINGKVSSAKTNSKGVAKFTIKNVKPGTYKTSFSCSHRGSKSYNYGHSKVVIYQATAKLSAGNLVMKYHDGSSYHVSVKDSAGKPVKDIFVKSVLNGKSYMYETNADGVAKLKIKNNIGYYTIKSVLNDKRYKSNAVSKHILVNGTKFVAKNKYASANSKFTFSVKLIDGKRNPIKNAKTVLTLKGKTYKVKSDSKGIVKVSLGALSKGNYAIKYSHGSFSGSSKIFVVDKVTIKQIIASSKNVKNYINKHGKLPSSVKIGNVALPTSVYMYLASKAIVKLESGSKSSISIKNVKNPSSPKAASNLGNLYDYLSVAKKVVKSGSKGKMPNSVSSSVGTIGYKGLVYAFTRICTFYGDNHRLPSYVAVKSLPSKSSSSSSSSGLNSKNTIKNLAAFLAASTNCQVNNAKIKELVTKLTKSCKTSKEKARAIFNYVRDTCSYSFYYDTKYGAVGTLKAKTGNCVDHSHLLVAMFRTAGLAARYGHGSCTFSSGSTYGHVWSQVLIGDTWTVADATSSRNSLGKVANWNTNSYKLYGYSSKISF